MIQTTHKFYIFALRHTSSYCTTEVMLNCLPVNDQSGQIRNALEICKADKQKQNAKK
jgi:hypothetical protein